MNKKWLAIQDWYWRHGYRHAAASMEDIVAAHKGDADVLMRKLNIK